MSKTAMNGQYELFSIMPPKKRKPCEYSFQRYIGQKVEDSHGTHTIKSIEQFYTFYEDGMVGSPHDMSPVNRDEYAEMIDVEIEYNQYLANGKDRTNRNIGISNLSILTEIKKQIAARTGGPAGKEAQDGIKA